jgi:hypothetical protein
MVMIMTAGLRAFEIADGIGLELPRAAGAAEKMGLSLVLDAMLRRCRVDLHAADRVGSEIFRSCRFLIHFSALNSLSVLPIPLTTHCQFCRFR